MSALFKRVVLSIIENHLEVVVLLRGFLDIGIHLHAPRLTEIALAHADLKHLLAASTGTRCSRFIRLWCTPDHNQYAHGQE
ncbi:MAG: hypothetical protein ACC628_02350 [Pirellulaceae bacterium]